MIRPYFYRTFFVAKVKNILKKIGNISSISEKMKCKLWEINKVAF